MGWYSGHRPKGQSVREYLVSDGLDDTKIVDFAVKHRTTAYIAYEHEGEIVALVYLLQYGRGYYNFTYKSLDESMGPSESECPERILDLLTSTDHEYAVEWRARCRRNIAVRRSVKKGTVVKFVQPVEFSNGVTLDTMIYSGRGNIFHDPAGPEYGRYRMPGWVGQIKREEVTAA
jgi:hypothetical protein